MSSLLFEIFATGIEEGRVLYHGFWREVSFWIVLRRILETACISISFRQKNEIIP